MPQVRCPNCGFTINLENRKEIDFGLIKNATRKQPKTFTELLHMTRLSRKTLNLRLHELCSEGVLMKENNFYKLNGSIRIEDRGTSFIKGFSNGLQNKKLRTGLMLIALILFSSGSGYVLALLMPLPNPNAQNQEKLVIGSFTMVLDVNNVTDLYSWQVPIYYNSSQLKFLQITSGDFVGVHFPFLFNSTDTFDNILLVGGTLYGDVPGKDGSGRLANIVFGYYTEDYELPRIASEKQDWLVLFNSKSELIPTDNVLTLTPL